MARPKCTNCQTRGLDCSYPDAVRRRGPGKKKKEKDASAGPGAGEVALEHQHQHPEPLPPPTYYRHGIPVVRPRKKAARSRSSADLEDSSLSVRAVFLPVLCVVELIWCMQPVASPSHPHPHVHSHPPMMYAPVDASGTPVPVPATMLAHMHAHTHQPGLIVIQPEPASHETPVSNPFAKVLLLRSCFAHICASFYSLRSADAADRAGA